MINPNEIHEKMRLTGNEWAVLDGAASLLEEQKKAVKARFMAQCKDMPVNKAEMMAESSVEYSMHIEAMVEARTQANKAKVDYDSIKAWIDLVRSLEASNRAQMRL